MYRRPFPTVLLSLFCALVLLALGCAEEERVKTRFGPGDFVRVRLTGERVQVLSVYEGYIPIRYDCRVGSVRERAHPVGLITNPTTTKRTYDDVMFREFELEEDIDAPSAVSPDPR